MNAHSLSAVFPAPGVPPEIRSYPIPEIESGGVLLKVIASEVCGTDVHLWQGALSLTVNLPNGDALLIFTGLHGAAELYPIPGLARAFRVVAALLPQVLAMLAREE